MVSESRVAVVLLAAGASRRFGAEDKLTADLDGRALGLHGADAIADMGFAARVAVVGKADPGFAARGFLVVPNDAPERGMAHSLALGIAAVADDAAVDAAMILLADMPRVPRDHIRALLAAFDGDRIASRGDGTITPPALFGRMHFEALRAMRGDHGAKPLLRDAPSLAADPRWLDDVDTPDDLAQLRAGSAAAGAGERG